MTDLYKRLYEITLSEPLIDPVQYNEPPPPPLINRPPVKDSNYNIINEANQVVIRELDFEATITKSRTSGVNELDLTLYNIGEDSHNIVEQTGAMVILKAGYKSVHGVHSNLPSLFVGQITSLEITKEETRVVTNIKAADGAEMVKNQRVTYEATPDTPVSTVIRELALSFNNVVEGHLALEDIEGEVFPTGYSAFGLLKDVLLEVCKSRKLRFSIEENSIYVFPDSWYRIAEQSGIVPYASTEAAAWERNVSRAKTNNFSKGQVLTFEPDTVISARKLIEWKGSKNGSGKPAEGISIKIPTYTKFNTQLDRVKLSEEFPPDISGEYSIEALTHNLNSREGEWATTLELTTDAQGA